MKGTRYAVKVVSLQVRDAGPPQTRVSSPEEAKAVLLPYFQSVRDDRERFVALALTSRNTLIGIAEISIGGALASIVDPKVLFRTLLVMGATRFILAHNHPSGDSSPSREDLSITGKLRKAGELLELELVDHLIVGDGTGAVTSLCETGRLT